MALLSSPDKKVDSYRFLRGMTKRIVKTWVSLDQPAEIPWTPLKKSLNTCTVAMITSGGIALKTDRPFDEEIERRDPWFSDPSYRTIPRDTLTQDIKCYHLHFNPEICERDLGCIFPLRQLVELETLGEIGGAAPSHYSYMGYTLRPQRFLEESVPMIIRRLQQENVDVVVLVPV